MRLIKENKTLMSDEWYKRYGRIKRIDNFSFYYINSSYRYIRLYRLIDYSCSSSKYFL